MPRDRTRQRRTRYTGGLYKKTGYWTDQTTGSREPYEYWQAVREVTPEHLKPGVERKRITGSGPTQREALLRLDENWVRYHSGNPTPRTRRRGKPRVTLAELFQEWQRDNSLRISDTMLKKYEGYFRLHISPALGSRKLDELEESQLLVFFAQTLPAKKRRDGKPLLGAAARRNIYKALATCLAFGVRKGYLERSPLRGVRVPAVSQPDEDVQLVSRNAKEVLAAIRAAGEPDYSRWLFQFLGLRRAERLGLTWSCVQGLDTDSPTVVIKQQLARREDGSGWYIKPETKTSKQRKVVLVEPFLTALRQHREAQDVQRQSPLWKPDPKFADLVFLLPDGGHYTLNRDNREWAKLLASLKLPHWRAHLNRHITATWLAEQRTDVVLAKGILGHESDAMNYYYARTAELDQAEPMRRYGQHIAEATGG